jgi:hypothetical protein
MRFYEIVLGCLVAIGGMALAQNLPVQKAVFYEGSSTNSPQCPAIRYLFRGIAENPIGYVWFSDASGMSKATGTMDLASGVFHLTLTSLDGQGPLGEATGRKDPATGVVTAELNGPGCSKLKLGPTNPYVRKADGTD